MPSIRSKLMSLDTETTGVDFWHGSKPFLVTTCDEDGKQIYWEWDVDPITREPLIPQKDKEEILSLMNSVDEIVLQNSKFDFHALQTIFGNDWQPPWEKVHDTLIAGHLLHSGMPHDLTSMAMQYMGFDAQPYEDTMEKAVREAIRLARSKHPDWMIAKAGLPCMPSAKGKTWKFDTWLLRVLRKENHGDKSWDTITSEYANVDSAVTIQLHLSQQKEIKQNEGLRKLYNERLKLLPIVYKLERLGITLNKKNSERQFKEFKKRSLQHSWNCGKIANKRGYKLTLPKSGNNKNLLTFVFDNLKLEPIEFTEKGNPKFDGFFMDFYCLKLPKESDSKIFLENLNFKRKCDTSCAYIQGYKNFWIKTSDKNFSVIHPSVNITGTKTVRFSNRNPNGQNVGKKEGFNLRKCFAPSSGKIWICVDAVNLELKVSAYSSGEEDMIKLFESPDEPPYFGSNHLLTGHAIFTEEFENLGPKKFKETELYDRSKRGNFSIQYGGQKKTVDSTFGVKGAYEILEDRFQKITLKRKSLIHEALETGKIQTVIENDIGTGYPIEVEKKHANTAAFSYYIQGTSDRIMQRAMVKSSGVNTVMLIHDEIIFECHDDELEEVSLVLDTLDSIGMDFFNIPINFSRKIIKRNWGEGE